MIAKAQPRPARLKVLLGAIRVMLRSFDARIQRCDRQVRFTRIENQIAVHLVGDQDQALALHELRQALEFVSAVHRTTGILRVAERRSADRAGRDAVPASRDR